MVACPFQSHEANIVEASLLCSLTAITIFNGPSLTKGRAIATQTIFFVTVAVLFTFMLWKDGKFKLRWKAPAASPGYRIPALDEEDDGTMLRDPLLADPYHPRTEEENQV